jgi:hypothetical protein
MTDMSHARGVPRLLMLAAVAAIAVCQASCAARVLDVGALETKSKAVAGRGTIASRADIEHERWAVQDRALEEFRACPTCFARIHRREDRHFIFDAVVDCETAIRVGRMADGGKWVCDPLQLPPEPVVYSFGAGDDVSFDTDMAVLFGSRVYLFDPSPTVVGRFGQSSWDRAFGHGHLYFQALGVGSVTSSDGLVLEGKKCPVKTVADIARSLHHERVDVVKMDIEGGEYAVLKQVLEAKTLAALNVRQLEIEFHLWDDQAFVDFVGAIDALRREGYVIFRKEFNPIDARCAEYAFVKVQPTSAAPK